MTNNKPKICGACIHWHRLPKNPMALQAQQMGQCRESPPGVTLLPSPQGVAIITDYPQPSEEFPACSRYKASLALAVQGEQG